MSDAGGMEGRGRGRAPLEEGGAGLEERGAPVTSCPVYTSMLEALVVLDTSLQVMAG